jgi:hypothetical protein
MCLAQCVATGRSSLGQHKVHKKNFAVFDPAVVTFVYIGSAKLLALATTSDIAAGIGQRD